ncbi:MAG TPA: hypothetical protein VJ552_09155 [Sediminibacterium sp.]|nr:hypothetical protein [Sediminibacterium sp.]
MKHIYHPLFRPALFIIGGILFSLTAKAQEPARIKLATFIDAMIHPGSNLSEAQKRFPAGAGWESAMADEFSAEREQSASVAESFYTVFKTNLAKLQSGKVSAGQFSVAEQNMMQSYQKVYAPLPEEEAFLGFRLMMEQRPEIGSGKMSWNKMKNPSAKALSLKQQIISLEKRLNWRALQDGSTDRQLRFGSTDERIIACNQKIQERRAAIPKKKIEVFAGVFSEMEDPVKMSELFRQVEKEKQAIFQDNYASLYQWWESGYSELKAISGKLDELLNATDFGSALTGSDQEVVPLMADLQLRIWEALYSFSGLTKRMLVHAQTAELSQQQSETNIEIYKQYLKTK